MSAKDRRPDFVIIGGMKCGTTSLFQYLSNHPELSPSSVKEPGFFSKVAWDKGIDWYESLFRSTTRLKFEASTAYAKHPNFGPVPERMAQLIPNAKLLYIIRHPVDRVRSELVHNVLAGRLHVSKLTDKAYWDSGVQFAINCSRYYWQLKQYLPYFTKDQIHVITLEDLSADPAGELNEVLTFLDLLPGFYQKGAEYKKFNASLRGNLRARWKRIKTHRQIKNWQLTQTQIQRIWRDCAEDVEAMETFLGRSLGYTSPMRYSSE